MKQLVLAEVTEIPPSCGTIVSAEKIGPGGLGENS